MTPRPGVRLDGRFELTRQIAVGGMGQVWAAIELATRQQVAVKVLRPEFAGEQLFLDRIAAEARNSHVLSHPGIARTYDHGVIDGLGYLVMEFVYGEPLSEVLAREGTLEPQQVLDIVAQTADALGAAHAAGVVHRDIKPANLLISDGGVVTITDFGISIAANQAPMTAAGMVMGTAQYLPPEQAMGRPATGAGDIYALGIIAYESLVGHRPFTGPTQVDIAFAHVTEPLPPLPGSVDLPLRILVEQMLAKDPADRPASAQRVASRARDLLAAGGPWDRERAAAAWPPTREAALPVPDRKAPDTMVPTTSGPIPAVTGVTLAGGAGGAGGAAPAGSTAGPAGSTAGPPAPTGPIATAAPVVATAPSRRGAHAAEAPPDTGMIRRRRRGSHAARAAYQEDHTLPAQFGSHAAPAPITAATPVVTTPRREAGRHQAAGAAEVSGAVEASGPTEAAPPAEAAGPTEAAGPATTAEATGPDEAVADTRRRRRRRRRDGGNPAGVEDVPEVAAAASAEAAEASGQEPPLPSRRSLRRSAGRTSQQFVVGFTAVITASVTTLAVGLGDDLGQSGSSADGATSIGSYIDGVQQW